MDDKKIVALQRGSVIVISLLAFLMSLKSDVVFAVALLASAGLGATFGPVSYTHLDVYKRQILLHLNNINVTYATRLPDSEKWMFTNGEFV